MNVRRLRCIENLDSSFSKGRIFIEYGNYPGFFYPENEASITGCGFCEGFLKKKKIRKYFEEIESIPFKKTRWYKIAVEDVKGEINVLELGIRVSQERLAEMQELLKRMQE